MLGTEDLYKYVEKYGLTLDAYYNNLGSIPKKPWSKFITNDNMSLCPPEALDLLSKMLVYDHADRILPSEAMEHEYFAPIRDNKKK